MSKSIIATTYDLLTFHQSGNDGTFDSCFEKVLAFLDVSLDEAMKTKYRRWSFQFFRTTGYLDVVPGESKWAISPAALVQTSADKFVLVGSTKELALFRALVDKDEVETCAPRIQHAGFPKDVYLFPELLALRGNLLRARNVGARLGVAVSEQYQNVIFSRLPSLGSVLDSLLILVGSGSVFEANSAKVFDVRKKEWLTFVGMYPDGPGLYRHDYKYSPPKYYVCVEKCSGEYSVYLIRDREWVLPSFCFSFEKKIPISYQATSKTVHLPKLQFAELRLPTLLEKCLRSGSIMEPELLRGGLSYKNVEPANFWTLVSRIPIFRVEQI